MTTWILKITQWRQFLFWEKDNFFPSFYFYIQKKICLKKKKSSALNKDRSSVFLISSFLLSLSLSIYIYIYKQKSYLFTSRRVCACHQVWDRKEFYVCVRPLLVPYPVICSVNLLVFLFCCFFFKFKFKHVATKWKIRNQFYPDGHIIRIIDDAVRFNFTENIPNSIMSWIWSI